MGRKKVAYSQLGKEAKKHIILEAKTTLDILGRNEGTALVQDILTTQWGKSIKQVKSF